MKSFNPRSLAASRGRQRRGGLAVGQTAESSSRTQDTQATSSSGQNLSATQSRRNGTPTSFISHPPRPFPCTHSPMARRSQPGHTIDSPTPRRCCITIVMVHDPRTRPRTRLEASQIHKANPRPSPPCLVVIHQRGCGACSGTAAPFRGAVGRSWLVAARLSV